MLKPDQIPYEVKRAMRAAWARRNNDDAPEKHMADLMLAGLEAWPGVEPHKVLTVRDNGEGYDLKQIGIILPLPQEVIPK